MNFTEYLAAALALIVIASLTIWAWLDAKEYQELYGEMDELDEADRTP